MDTGHRALGGEFQRWQNLQEKLANGWHSYKDGDPVPSLVP